MQFGNLHTALGFIHTQSQGARYSAEATALFTAMSPPPDKARKDIDAALISALQASGDWPELDVLYVNASHASQPGTVCWKTPGSNTLTLVNAPAFTANKGFKGDPPSLTDIYSSYNPTTFPSARYVQNSGTIGVWLLQANTTNSAIDCYLTSSRLARQSTGTNYQGRINDGTAINAGTPTAGHWAIQRTGPTARAMYKNKVLVTSDAQASIAVANAVLHFLSTGSGSYSDAQLAIGYVGSGALNIAALHDAFTTHLTAIGAFA